MDRGRESLILSTRIISSSYDKRAGSSDDERAARADGHRRGLSFLESAPPSDAAACFASGTTLAPFGTLAATTRNGPRATRRRRNDGRLRSQRSTEAPDAGNHPRDVPGALSARREIGGTIAPRDEERIERPAIETETVGPIDTGGAFVWDDLVSSFRDSLRYGAVTAPAKRTIGGGVAVDTSDEVETAANEEADGISRQPRTPLN
ncbi:hypothetical protein EA472_15535 [Natrarchaeobius oligotrophus]|uniref:Uncharacterized protein n=1 Tax=Natrarchaeobius chitinivorans TaxID=1679083 RepID=A0A3N6M5V8_NATCH|nr:hypothetical protein EA472_15535 [Natrarchaeobius chitinivorans]